MKVRSLRRAAAPLCAGLAALGLAGSPTGPPAGAPQPTARPMLWQIQGTPPSYLYGTIHYPDPRVTALPESVERALASSDVFLSELPLDKLSQARMLAGYLLPQGQTVEELLPKPLYERTRRYLTEGGIPAAAFDRMKIWAVSLFAVLRDYLARGVEHPPLDLYLYERAGAQGAALDAFETIEEQVEMMDSLSFDTQLYMLASTLDQLEAVQPGELHPVEGLLRLYLAGDEDALMEEAFRQMDPEENPLGAEVMEVILDRRNRAMAEKIAAHLAREPKRSHFFAVGALHMPGPAGILALLAERGLVVERVGADGGALPEGAGLHGPRARPAPAPLSPSVLAAARAFPTPHAPLHELGGDPVAFETGRRPAEFPAPGAARAHPQLWRTRQ